MTPITAEDRRSNDPILMALIQQIHDSQMEMDRKLTKHMETETTELASAITTLMSDAFPAGDLHGHKRAHAAWIEEVEERTDFYRNMKKKLVEWGLLGFLGWAGYALWQAFLLGPRK